MADTTCGLFGAVYLLAFVGRWEGGSENVAGFGVTGRLERQVELWCLEEGVLGSEIGRLSLAHTKETSAETEVATDFIQFDYCLDLSEFVIMDYCSTSISAT